ncbi:MAG: DUF885 domain-containing protein [Gammaproteobacteria bacterium]|nr:DUF885 domain-containing protein [Gammaproteobacteria bacterium]
MHSRLWSAAFLAAAGLCGCEANQDAAQDGTNDAGIAAQQTEASRSSSGTGAGDGAGDSGARAGPAATRGDAPAAGETAAEAAEWDAFVDRFIEGYFEAHPTFAVVQGRHEFDGLLPDWSREGIDNEIERLRNLRLEAERFDEADLDPERRFQRDYLISRIDRDLFWLDAADWPFRNPAFYFDWMLDSLDPSPYVTLTYAPPRERLASITRYLENIPRAARQIRANLQTPLPAPYVQLGIDSFGGLADYFGNELVQAFAEVDDAALRRAFDSARQPAIEAMAGLRTWLENERAGATDEFAIGAELFQRMLRDTEGVDVPLDELERIGRADLERNTAALREACAEYAPGQNIRACFDRMAGNKPEGGVVEAASRQLDVLKAHVVENDIVTVPSDERAEVREAPPFARSNFAYINIPGPYETGQPSIYFIAPPDPGWSEEVQQGYIPGEADLLFTSVHEVWPGHFLNFLHAKQADALFGRIFVGYAFAEGWAHYAEEMMWEAGLGDGNPEIRIGQVSNALMRDCRFLSAIGLHTGEMSVEESEALFRDACFQDEGTARQQAARGTYDPAYLNYTMGKLLIRQLREDWTAGRGGRDAWKAFHDEFLSHGGPPIPLVRAEMLGGEPEAVFGEPAAAEADDGAAAVQSSAAPATAEAGSEDAAVQPPAAPAAAEADDAAAAARQLAAGRR